MSAKLYFHYGCVSAGKSTALLQVAHNYSDCGLRAAILVPEVARDSDVVRSRIGIEAPAITLSTSTSIIDVIGGQEDRPSAVLVDEAQFLTEEQVHQLTAIVDGICVPILCYGLRVDFRGVPFTGSSALLALADKIVEIRTICAVCCSRKATMHLKVDTDGCALRGGQAVDVAAMYRPVCRRCWRNGMAEARD